MDRLQAMQTFVRVVETGSFSAVAREQNTTQSAVSKQVAALERHLGARLMTRSTRSLALTEDGERYFEDARRFVNEISEAESTLRRGEQQLSGWLRVAAAVGYGVRVLLPRIQGFMAAHPTLKIDLRLHDGFIDLVGEGIDVAVRIGDLSDSSLVARRLTTTRRAAFASPGYLAALPAGLSAPLVPDDLRHHNCIVYTELSTRNVWGFTAADGTVVDVRVEGTLQSNSSEVVRAAGLSGMGICYTPMWLFEEEVARGRMQVLLSDWPMRQVPVHLLSPAQRHRAAKVRAFGDYLIESFRA